MEQQLKNKVLIKQQLILKYLKNIITVRKQAKFMITLKNIKIENNVVECDIFPENSKEKGYIKVDIKSGVIENYSLPAGFEYCENHVCKAREYLIKHIKDISTIPIHEKTIMWH